MEDDEHLQDRHSSYAHLARLLREAVEVFGQRTLFAKVKKFFHCVEKELMFRQTCGYFNMPTSTSINYETVINLDFAKGIVLQFVDNNTTHLNGGLRFLICHGLVIIHMNMKCYLYQVYRHYILKQLYNVI